MLGTSPVMAEEEDKFEISAGGYSVFRCESSVSLTETNVGAGISISPRDTLGLDAVSKPSFDWMASTDSIPTTR